MPMMVGHSQGGIQLVKVLHDLAGDGVAQIPVWNPHTDTAEPRVTIVDPFTGAERPVVGLKIGYASVVGSGGAALMLPNQWSMVRRLRTDPRHGGRFHRLCAGAWTWWPGTCRAPARRYQAQGTRTGAQRRAAGGVFACLRAADLAPGARRGDARLAQRLPARAARAAAGDGPLHRQQPVGGRRLVPHQEALGAGGAEGGARAARAGQRADGRRQPTQAAWPAPKAPH